VLLPRRWRRRLLLLPWRRACTLREGRLLLMVLL